ncbi:NACHT, LRR and PYD domains-containing protein 3-like isoform X2 [Scyliorhinus canicula]|nr:NACHT, LRR and PYD domains-containing protein 3-like isoform X2 [Scyliorhinus canicula]
MDIAAGLPDLPSQLDGVRERHREKLRIQTEILRLNTILMKEKQKVYPLMERYARLTVISPVRVLASVQHELLARGQDHRKLREGQLRQSLLKIRPDQLFRRRSRRGASAAVCGVPGIGKTTLMQKVVHDWARGEIYPHFRFLFSFKFRDLNAINFRINLQNLILNFYPYFRSVGEALWKNPEELLFIFDGLDEFKDSVDFADKRRNTEPLTVCTDPEFRCKVSDIVYSLIQHKLLPGCSVLVTSRPTALHLLEKAEISVWAEILGFVGDERKEYFNKFFEDQTVAAAVVKHVEENEILYTMCYNPSYCWILGLSLGPFFTQSDRKQQRVPKTITQLYSYYIYNILKNHSREIESPRDVLLKLGQMAFTGVSEKKIVFRNEDLIESNLQPSQFLSGFLMELLERDDSAQSAVYTFPHLTIQEFVAALAQFLTPDPGDIRELLCTAHSQRDGRFEIFLRFVAGLSSPRAAWPLEKVLGPFRSQATRRAIDWVKERLVGQIGKDGTGRRGGGGLLNALHYLFESQNTELARSTVGSVETLQFDGLRLTPIDCVVLSHVVGMCRGVKEQGVKELDLEGCQIGLEGLQRLLPALHGCRALGLDRNRLGNPGVTLLSEFVRSPGCELQRLQLADNGFSGCSVANLATSLCTNRSLVALDLGRNKLGDSGVRSLCEALKNPDCVMQQVKLYDVGLTHCCAQALADVLRTTRSLRELNLSNNKLGDSGMKLLSEALRNTDCTIRHLRLDDNGLTDSCSEDLSGALAVNRTLTILSLRLNGFTDNSYGAFFNLIRNCESLGMIGLRDNRFSDMTKILLRSLQNARLDVVA